MLVLGIDSSTTSVKAIAWDAHGNAVAEGRAALSLENPETDAWEQDAESWWTATIAAIAEALRDLGARANELGALSIANQRETFVVTDDRGRPLAPARVWMDARGRGQVKKAIDRLGADRLHDESGKPACITPSLYKIMELFEERPDLVAKKPSVLDVHAFLVWRLTGRRATSLAAADPLGLVDMRARNWSEPFLELAGIEKDALPELLEPGDEIGRVTAQTSAATGLPVGLPVIAGAGDGQAAGLGAGIVAPGRAYLNLGTAVVSGVLSNDYRIDQSFRTLYGASAGTFFLETDLKGGTFILSWLVERFSRQSLATLEHDAKHIAPGAGGLLRVPYWNGVMNPYWDDDATGIMVGLTGSHGPAHVHRAILEGIAFEQRLHTSGVEHATNRKIDEMVVMGGGAKSDLWCQILADVLDKRIVRAKSSEATALGAGMLAAVACGLHPNLDAAVAQMTGTAEAFEPGPARDTYRDLYAIYVELFPALRASLSKLSALTRPG